MRRISLVVFAAIIFFASFADASERRRGVRRAPEGMSVEAVLSVIYLTDREGTVYPWVSMNSMQRMSLGTTFVSSVQKPGANEFIPIASRTVQTHEVGYYTDWTVYLKDGFYDIVDGRREEWTPGIAVFRVDIIPIAGEKTSVSQRVAVRLDDLRVPLGPLQQAIPSADGRSIMLLGVFPTPPTAMLFKFYADGSYMNKPVSVYQNQFFVPEGMSGVGSPLTVMTGYPHAECSTVEVDIPDPQ